MNNRQKTQRRILRSDVRKHPFVDASAARRARKLVSVAAMLMTSSVFAQSMSCPSGWQTGSANSAWCGSWTAGVWDAAYGAFTTQIQLPPPVTQYAYKDSQVACVNSNPLKTTTVLSNNACVQPVDGTTVTPIAIGTVQLTGPGFDSAIGPLSQHNGNVGSVVAINSTQTANNTGNLVVFLGGLTSDPQAYTYFLERAATEPGVVAAISLQYENSADINQLCQKQDACFTQTRGEVLYGDAVSYPLATNPIGQTFSGSVFVSKTNSIANRLVMTLDFLQAHPPAGTTPAFWAHFLANVVSGGSGPYTNAFVGTTSKPMYPWWPQIILAGHSQGGSEAAFAMTTLAYSAAPTAKGTGPLAGKVPRGILLSAPEDVISNAAQYNVPSWVYYSTVADRLWGLRHGQKYYSSDEGTFGQDVFNNWKNFGAGSSNSATGIRQAATSVFGQSCLDITAVNPSGQAGTWQNPIILPCGPTVLPDMSAMRQFVLASSLVESSSVPNPTALSADPNIVALNAHDSTAADSFATDMTLSNIDPTAGQTNPDSSQAASSRRSIMWAPNVSALNCITGETCSILNPNIALLWDAMFTNTQ